MPDKRVTMSTSVNDVDTTIAQAEDDLLAVAVYLDIIREFYTVEVLEAMENTE